jgi:hypothetical protein
MRRLDGKVALFKLFRPDLKNPSVDQGTVNR